MNVTGGRVDVHGGHQFLESGYGLAQGLVERQRYSHRGVRDDRAVVSSCHRASK